jgi:protoporphyrinogen oxidase
MKVIVVGAGLSGLAAAYRLKRTGCNVEVLEAADRPGGRCATLRRDGFIIDTGPEIVAGSYGHYLRLLEDVGLADQLVPSSPIIGSVRDGRVIDNDSSKPLRMAFTPLLSWRAKLRLFFGLRKVWKTASMLDAYSMADFPEYDDPLISAEQKALELFGTEAVDYLIDPLVRMIGGASPARISQLLMLGGLNSWSASLCNIRGGLDTVPAAVARELDVQYQARVTSVRETQDGVIVQYLDAAGSECELRADQCLLACQLDEASRLSPFVARLAAPYLAKLPFAKLIDVKLAYKAATRSRAFACQVPTKENRALLMYGLTHNKAPDRAPAGHSLFTLYTADEVFDEMAAKTDDELIFWARKQMEPLYPEIQGHFLFGHAGRYAKAGYRADPGYFQRTAELIAAIPKESRIQIGGDVFGGGSMEAAVLWGERAAANLRGQQHH